MEKVEKSLLEKVLEKELDELEELEESVEDGIMGIEVQKQDMKYCINCGHVLIASDGYWCRRPDNGLGCNLVIGGQENRLCKDERFCDDGDLCGYGAKYYVDKGLTE